MAAIVRLVVLTGPHAGHRFCLRGQSLCLIGRSPECDIRLCGADRDKNISRRHCELSFDPPHLRVQDLGSCNGTFVNAQRVGQEQDEVTSAIFQSGVRMAAVREGDVLNVGGTSLRVDFVDCPLHAVSDNGEEVAWRDQEVVKADCPVAC